MIAILPQELIDMIIEHLAGDRRALKACSVVCHAFLSASRTHLHHWVEIDERTCRSAAESLTASVADHTMEVSIESPYDNFEWLSEGSLAYILQRLVRLQKIRLNRCSWSTLTPEFQEEVFRTLRRPSLRHVQLYSISLLPISFFSQFVGLKHLELASVSLMVPEEEESVVLPHTGPQSQLESLGLSIVPRELPAVTVEEQRNCLITIVDLLLNKSTALDATRLRHISIDIELTKVIKHGLCRLLKETSATLEHLTFHAAIHGEVNPFIPASEYLSLESLPALESLKVVFFVVERETIRWLIHILCTFALPNRIRKITIVFLINNIPEIEDRLWVSLDAAFTQPALASLVSLTIEWSVYPAELGQVSGEEFASLVRSKLPIASGRNILSVREMEDELIPYITIDLC